MADYSCARRAQRGVSRRTVCVPGAPNCCQPIRATTTTCGQVSHATLPQAYEECDEDTARLMQAIAVFSEACNSFPRHAIPSVSKGFADLQTSGGLAYYCKASFAAHQFSSAKPDPAIFLAACEGPRYSVQ